MQASVPILGEPLAIELANTRFLRRGQELDGLAAPGDLAAWLRQMASRLPIALGEQDLAAIGPQDAEAARRLRDALRALLAAATEDRPLDASDVLVLNATARAAPRWLELSGDERGAVAVRHTAPAVDATLAVIAEDAVALLAGPDAAELRACAAPDCMLFFRKDHPRRSWCSPRCSSRARASRHYARHRRAPSPPQTR